MMVLVRIYHVENAGILKFIVLSIIVTSIILHSASAYTLLQLKITLQSYENHQTVISANFPFDPPIKVELINKSTGLLESRGPNSQLRVVAATRNSSYCISSNSFNLLGGVGEFHGSLCKSTKGEKLYLYFQCNSTLGLLSTNYTKPIFVTSDIHIAYFRPHNEEKILNNQLEDFMKSVLRTCFDESHCSKSALYKHLPGRTVKMKTYLYKAQDPSSIIKEYLTMKEYHHKHPHEKAFAIIGLNNKFASKILLPLLMRDKYAVTSYRKDVSSEFSHYQYFNRIHLSDVEFMENVFLYLNGTKWNKVNYIYLEDDDYIDSAQCRLAADRYGITIQKHKIEVDNRNTTLINYKSLFKSILKSGFRIILTPVTGNVAKKLIMEANLNGVTSIDGFQWIGLKNERHFSFIFENDQRNFTKEKPDKFKSSDLISMRFKGMIFINNVYELDNLNSEFEYVITDFIAKDQKTSAKTSRLDEYKKDKMSYGLAYDVLLIHLYALKSLIVNKKTVDGISLSKKIRQTEFHGVTGKVYLDQKLGTRYFFRGIIYIIWPEMSYWKKTVGKFLFNNILLKRDDVLTMTGIRYDDEMTEIKVLSFELLKMLVTVNKPEDIFNAYIPLEYWNRNYKNSKNLTFMNKVNVSRHNGYFHDEYNEMIKNPINPSFYNKWFWPERIGDNVTKVEKLIIAPFYCESGCGGAQRKYDVNIFDNGVCVAHNVCRCERMRWHGFDCTIPICEGCHPDYGSCDAPGVCSCSKGYMLQNCTLPACVPECYKNGGICIKPDMCVCDTKHYGKTCDKECTCKNGLCNNGGNGDGHCKSCNSGYYGENCQSSYILLILLTILGLGALCVVTCVGVRAVQKDRQLKKSLLSNDWIINWTDVNTEDDAPSKGNTMLSAISMNRNIHLERKQLNVGIWKGITVHYRKLDKNTIELTKEIQLEIKQVRDIKHPNIVPLIGCSIEYPNIAILTELQHKGSIRDILANDDIEVPWKFRFSLMKDICKGLSFIHKSAIRSHGRLKSSNCLVDNKWTVKLSGFGLHEFRSGQESVGPFSQGITSEAKTEGSNYESLLWTSPEILATFVYHIDHVLCGSVHGDIYSFGMVLSEFCTRTLPFSDLKLPSVDLINLIAGERDASKLKIWNDYITKNNVEEGGLVRPCIKDKQLPPQFEVSNSFRNLIEKCWDEDPIKRPSIIECGVALHHIEPQPNEPMEQLVATLEQYSTNLENVVHKRNKELQSELQKTEDLVSRLLPKTVAENLKQGKNVETTYFENVTLCITNLVGFSLFTKEDSSSEVVALLNDIFSLFDSVSAKYEVLKVEAFLDGYMLASGLPTSNDRHAAEICNAALDLMQSFSSFAAAGLAKNKFQIHVIINSGGIVAGIVGLNAPKYCLFGDTVDIAVLMTYMGEPSCIHFTENTFNELIRMGGFIHEFKDEVRIKSTTLKTYLLKGKKSVKF